jgi:Na+-driven multidrug efflux pump
MFALVVSFGTAATAAFGIGLRAFEVMYIYLGGLGSAGEVLVGQSLGRKTPELASRVSRRITVTALLLQLGTMPFLFAFAPGVIALFSKDLQVVRFGTEYLRVLAPMLLVVGLTTGWAAAQRGAGATTVPMIAALISNWLVKIPLAYLLAKTLGMGLTGIWLGIGASIVIETAILGFGYFRGGWLRKEVAWA